MLRVVLVLSLLIPSLVCEQSSAQTPPAPLPPPPEKKSEYSKSLYYRPTPVPDRVILTWNQDPSKSQAVTWRTDTSVKSAAVQFALSDGGPGFAKKRDNVLTVPATTSALTTDLGEAHYHSACMTGLLPRTKYVYRVGDGLNWSEWYQFETASDRADPLRFIYFGDAQNDLKSMWSRVIRGAYSDMPKAHFILHAGDLVNSGRNDHEWGEWFNAGGWINGMIPTVPSPGNHEYGGSTTKSAATTPVTPKPKDPPSKLTPHWRAQYTLPENGPAGLEESCYYFDIQGVRIISLNSNERQSEQIPWFENVLRNNPNLWTVVTFHHPIYSTKKGRDNKDLRAKWRPIFDKYGVDLVLTGHDHTYGRSGLMREDNLMIGGRVAEKGTVYVVSVSGPKMYDLERQNWMQSGAEGLQLYQLITIDGGRLQYESRTAKGDLYDAFELRKRPDGKSDLLENEQLEAERKSSLQPKSPSREQLIVALSALFGIVLIYGCLRAVKRTSGV